MTVAFALFLSPEGIALAHRQPAGHWALIGETGLEGDNLGPRLKALRDLGAARADTDFPTLLILPDDQILYTDLDVHEAPGLDLNAEVGRALDGRTPYALAELAWDYRHLAPGRVQVAAVAQETLTEAMDFARAAGFNAIGFAASPPAEKFSGVPIFEVSPGFGHLDLPGVGIEIGPDAWGDAPAALDPEPAQVFVTEAPGVAAAPETADVAAAPEEAQAETAASETTDADTAEGAGSGLEESAADDRSEEAAAALEAEEEAEEDAAPESVADADADVATGDDVPEAATGLDESSDEQSSEAREAEEPAASSLDAPPAAPGLAPSLEASDHEAAAFDMDSPVAEPPHPQGTESDPVDTASAAPTLRFGTHRAKVPAPGAVGRILRNQASRLGLAAASTRTESADEAPRVPRPDRAGPLPKRREPRMPAVMASRTAPEEPATPDTPLTHETQAQDASADDAVPAGLPKVLADRLRRRREAGGTIPAAPPLETEPPAAAAVAFTTTGEDDLPPPPVEFRHTTGDAARFGGGAEILEDDPMIAGGLLSRRTDVSARPSLRTALVLTIVLVLFLALVAVWSALFLPDSRVAQLLGRVAPELEVPPVAETGPVLAPDNAPPEADTQIASLPPADTDLPGTEAEDAPDAAATDPVPEPDADPVATEPDPADLPDIDADLPVPELADVAPPRPLPTREEVEAEYAETGIWQLAPDPPGRPATEFLVPEVDDDIYLASIDPVVLSLDAVALTAPGGRIADQRTYPSPLPFGTRITLGSDGLVEATPEGTLTPAGAFVIAGTPPVSARQRPGPDPEPQVAEPAADAADPEDAAAPQTAPGIEDAILATFQPTPRPGDLDERRERQQLGGLTREELGARRPETRPQSLQEIALAAQAAAAAVGDAPDGSELAVASSLRPGTRPASVAAAAADRAARGPAAGASTAGVATVPAPTVEPDIPSNATVSRSATMENVINLREVNLIGVTGTPNNRRALVRLPSGRFLTVEIGDRMDGGRVAAIGPNSLQYIKNGRNITLQVPSG